MGNEWHFNHEIGCGDFSCAIGEKSTTRSLRSGYIHVYAMLNNFDAVLRFFNVI